MTSWSQGRWRLFKQTAGQPNVWKKERKENKRKNEEEEKERKKKKREKRKILTRFGCTGIRLLSFKYLIKRVKRPPFISGEGICNTTIEEGSYLDLKNSYNEY